MKEHVTMKERVTVERRFAMAYVVNVDGRELLGIDLAAGIVGHWPDGEHWTPLLDIGSVVSAPQETTE